MDNEEENNDSVNISTESILEMLNSSDITDRQLYYCWDCGKWVTDHEPMDH